jgi:hypothetical protein
MSQALSTLVLILTGLILPIALRRTASTYQMKED